MKNSLKLLSLLSLCLVSSCSFIRALAFNHKDLQGCVLDAKNNKLVCATKDKGVFIERNGLAMNGHSCMPKSAAIAAAKCEPIVGEPCIINNNSAFCSNGKFELKKIDTWVCFESEELKDLLGQCAIRSKK